jgi:hypothetical protein
MDYSLYNPALPADTLFENDCTRIEALCRFAGLPGKERTKHDCAP